MCKNHFHKNERGMSLFIEVPLEMVTRLRHRAHTAQRSFNSYGDFRTGSLQKNSSVDLKGLEDPLYFSACVRAHATIEHPYCYSQIWQYNSCLEGFLPLHDQSSGGRLNKEPAQGTAKT
jgi:hypothetical protein